MLTKSIQLFLLIWIYWSVNVFLNNKTIGKADFPFNKHRELFLTVISARFTMFCCLLYNFSKRIFRMIYPIMLILNISVTISFWSLFFYDSDLIINKNLLKAEYSLKYYHLLQLGLHLAPLLLSITYFRQKPSRNSFIMPIIYLILSFYLMIVSKNKDYNCFTPYEFINRMSFVQFVTFIVFEIIFLKLLYLITIN
ncbi:hypothetical protein A0H76_2388 [Hepatospora eriocheir]|uniref:Uncharacterized protein n=1 Tax=Hepatospora eriocheir TaxID=1081669 RepID=A0A1X0QLD5_9MICR|nr:hypothetical protein A0H76_2388 [Hepatospora eriocheir]